MKNLFIILILMAVCWGCTPRQTQLNGHIANYHGEIVRICVEGSELRRDTLRVDSLGNFAFTPTEKQGMIYEISVKDHQPWVAVYLAEGDHSEVRLTLTSEKQVEAEFAGDRKAENDYLLAYRKVESSRIWYEPEMEGITFKVYRTKVEEMGQNLQALMDRVQDAGVKKLLAGRQHLMLQRQLTNYSWRYLSAWNGGQEKSDADYDAFMQSIEVNDPAECDDDILGSVIAWNMKQTGEEQEEDYLLAYLKVLDKVVENLEIKNHHATEQLMKQFQYFSGNDLGTVMARYNALCTDDTLKARVNAEYAEYDRVYGNLMPGKPAPDFEMMDINGNKCRLSDLKGKYLFVDFWATWCAPCREEIPYMAKLQEHFANDARIALISISVDANVKTWKNFLAKDKPTWAQYVVDAENNAILDKEYRIFGIPHFMLLDPEGRFVQYDFVRPSFPGCMEEIEQIVDR